jgi:hypothetical protein
MALVRGISEQPAEEYPAGVYSDEMVVWQLGAFREKRATDELQRIAAFSPEASAGRFGRTRKSLVTVAKEALAKLEEGAG